MTLECANGIVQVVPDSNRSEPAYLSFHVNPGSMYGVKSNSRQLRDFLRSSLRLLEQDALRRKDSDIADLVAR